jgi:hypothetical protein
MSLDTSDTRSPFNIYKKTKYGLLHRENYKDFKTFANPRGEVIKQNNPLEVDNSNTKKVIISGA